MNFADRVKETTETTGTGAYTLEGAEPGFQSFVDAVGSDELVPYMVTDGVDWEVGVGVTSVGGLTRAVVLSSSNGGVAVNWGAGVKTVALTLPATMIVDRTGDNTLTGTNTFNQQIVSAIITGTSPLAVASTTVCTNLNADMCDGQHLGTASTPQFAKLGVGVTPNAAQALTVGDTGDIRFENGSELGLIGVASDGALHIWAHGPNSTDEIRFLTQSGSGVVQLTVTNAGNLVINNSKGYQIKSSSGTAVNVLTLDASNHVTTVAGTGGNVKFAPNGGSQGVQVAIEAVTGNLLVGALAAAGTSLAGGIVIVNGTAPSTFPHAQMWAASGKPKVADTTGRIVTLTELSRDHCYNYLINGGFEWAQRQAPSTLTTIANSSLGPDRWKVFVQNNTLQHRRYVLSETGADLTSLNHYCYSHFVKITNAGKIAIGQMLPLADTYPLRGQEMRFQIKLRSDTARTYKIALVEWQGTENSANSDIIGSWNSDTVNPTFSNASFELLASETCAVTTSFQVFSVSGTLTTACNNIICLIWSDSQVPVNGYLEMAEAGLYHDNIERPWRPRHHLEEEDLVMQYFERFGGSFVLPIITGYRSGAGAAFHNWPIRTKRAGPSCTVNGTWALSNCSIGGVIGAGLSNIRVQLNVTATGIYQFSPDSADDYVDISAEIW